ncbi:hypothetical protein ILUMI_08557 [Ignelater luminosus]|uniref:Uncharacterized protein n=1 Tax=Ignelater luminosus TaxID=2038154 RepID=A0A8K0D5X1_IGNLU|nr:hypothetical protein ILUMI_08557 [Ignelater luminosus]
MSQKRPSGSEFRKRKRVRKIEAKKLGNSLRKWTQAENSQEADVPGISGTGTNLEIENEDMTLPNINTNDPVSWLPITDPVRCFLIEKDPDQGKGSKNIYLTEGSGVFLSAVDMISQFNPEVRAHIESLGKGNISYITPYKQNEIVEILTSEVKKQILDEDRAAEYFSMLFDSRAVKAINLQIPQIWCVLQNLTSNDYNAETIVTAKSIMGLINNKFICTLQIWDPILESVDRVNVALQSKTITIDKASELIKGLIRQIQNIRETADNVFEKAKKVCEECDIDDNFPEQRIKRVKRHNLSKTLDAGYDITPQQKHITKYSVEELKKHAADLCIKYSADINTTEFWAELETLKSQVVATELFVKCECQSSLGLLKAIVELDLKEMFPNVVVALKIF